MERSSLPVLPKWPALLVVGEAVTPEQAAEIIIRTSSFRFTTNARDFKAQLETALYGQVLDDYTQSAFDQQERKRQEYRVLDLEYLYNDQVCSCWVGGPHGWCHWDGRIHTNNYNIGKWPSEEEVLKEWQAIAAAFPFLSLRSQLLTERCVKKVNHSRWSSTSSRTAPPSRLHPPRSSRWLSTQSTTM